RDRLHAKDFLDRLARLDGAARPLPHPEELARVVPHAVAGALEQEAVGQAKHRVQQIARLQRPERGLDVRFLALALRMAAAGGQRIPPRSFTSPSSKQSGCACSVGRIMEPDRNGTCDPAARLALT